MNDDRRRIRRDACPIGKVLLGEATVWHRCGRARGKSAVQAGNAQGRSLCNASEESIPEAGPPERSASRILQRRRPAPLDRRQLLEVRPGARVKAVQQNLDQQSKLVQDSNTEVPSAQENYSSNIQGTHSKSARLNGSSQSASLDEGGTGGPVGGAGGSCARTEPAAPTTATTTRSS